jgi:isoleucyl-tRNA synthetase
VVEECRKHYDDFAFHRLYRRVYDFATTDLSALYFDIVKDRLYTFAPKSRERRSAQTAVYRINDALVRLLAPLLTFTCEEVWTHMGHSAGAPSSVHLADLPAGAELACDSSASGLETLTAILREAREDVMKHLEAARQTKFIGSGLEAQVQIGPGYPHYPLLASYDGPLAPLFIVSQVKLLSGDAPPIRIARAEGAKCARCWKYTTDVGSDPGFPTICKPCAGAVNQILNG